jgi:hypothetical protein
VKKTFFAAALATWCVLSGLAAEPAMLNTNASPGNLTDSYVGKLGAGVMVGEPTGMSLKYWLNDTLALDGAIGWSFHDNTDLYMQSDVLWHNFDLIPVPQGRLPLYFGVGGLVRVRDNNNDNQVGVRAPVGLSYMFDNVPVDIFVEIAPAIDFAPDVRGEITGGVGIRYWF